MDCTVPSSNFACAPFFVLFPLCLSTSNEIIRAGAREFLQKEETALHLWEIKHDWNNTIIFQMRSLELFCSHSCTVKTSQLNWLCWTRLDVLLSPELLSLFILHYIPLDINLMQCIMGETNSVAAELRRQAKQPRSWSYIILTTDQKNRCFAECTRHQIEAVDALLRDIWMRLWLV